MKISDSIKLTQKRNLITYLFGFSLKIKDLDYVKDIIYGEESYDLTTKMMTHVPSEPTNIFRNEIECDTFCKEAIKNFKLDLNYNIVIEGLRRSSKCEPNKPVLVVEGQNVSKVYDIFFKPKDFYELLICAEDYSSGFFIDVYCDYPTENNGWYDGPLYECFKW